MLCILVRENKNYTTFNQGRKFNRLFRCNKKYKPEKAYNTIYIKLKYYLH